MQGRGGRIPLSGDHLRSPPRSSHSSEGRIRLLPDAQASSGLSSRPAGPFLLVCSSISQLGLNLEVHPDAWPPGTEGLPRARGMHPVLTQNASRLLLAGKDSERITEKSHISLSRDHDPPRVVGLGADTARAFLGGLQRIAPGRRPHSPSPRAHSLAQGWGPGSPTPQWKPIESTFPAENSQIRSALCCWGFCP